MAFLQFWEPLSRRSLWVAVLSEFIGTFLLVAMGCGVIFINFSHLEINDVPNNARIILSGAGFGAVVGGVVISLTGGFPHGSAHVNPAFTIGCLVANKITAIRALLFIIVQNIGGIAGAAVLYLCVPTMREGIWMKDKAGFPCTVLTPGVPTLEGFIFEIFGTFVLIFAALALVAGHQAGKVSGVIVGGGLAAAVALLVITLGPYTGAGLNPSRSFGPSVAFGGKCWDDHWIYWAGPIAGGVLAGMVTRILYYDESKQNSKKRDPVGEAEADNLMPAPVGVSTRI